MGLPSRLWSRTSSPSRKTSVRNPSHFGSNCQPSPSGIRSAARESIGASGGANGRRTVPLSCTCQGAGFTPGRAGRGPRAPAPGERAAPARAPAVGARPAPAAGEAIVAVVLALAGDVMTGRGIDQILRAPSPPVIFEPVVRDARDYVAIAEAANGPIPRGVDDAYPWGDALPLLVRSAAARIVNLETAVTRSESAAPKGINYRMHPANVGCLAVAGIDV